MLDKIDEVYEIFKEPDQFKKFIFVNPKIVPSGQQQQQNPFIDICNENSLNDFLNHCKVNKNHPIYNIFIEGGYKMNELLNKFRSSLELNYDLQSILDYITLLRKFRKIFLNNSTLFEYYTNTMDNIIKSTSIDFELCMILYILAFNQQSLVDETNKDKNVLKNNSIYLMNAKLCFEEVENIIKEHIEKFDNLTSSINDDNDDETVNYPYNLMENKKFITKIKTSSINNKNSELYLIKQGEHKWIEDIGGINLIKTRSIIAFCQANEYYYKANKIILKEGKDNTVNCITIAYSISLKYKEIISKNGILGNEKYNDHPFKIYSKFLYYYWKLKVHQQIFHSSCKSYLNSENDQFIIYLNDLNEIPLELKRYDLIIKNYNKLTQIINKDKTLKSFTTKIEKKIQNIEDNYKNLKAEIAKWGNINNNNDDSFNYDFYPFNPLDCPFKEMIKNKQENNLNNIIKINPMIQNFINFCDNKPLTILKKFEDDKIESLTLQLRNNYATLKNYNNQNITNKKDFELGRITERLEWIKYLVQLYEKDNTLLDKISINVLIKSIKDVSDKPFTL